MFCTQLFILVLLTSGLALTSSLYIEEITDNNTHNETFNNKFQTQSDTIQDILNRLDRIEIVIKSLEKPTTAAKETIYTLFTDSKKNWFEAFADCRKRGLDLASIQNETEYQNILELIKDSEYTNSGNFWVSATDFLEDDAVVWMSTGEDVTFSEWCQSEPIELFNYNNDMSEHCMELRGDCDYGMNDQVCSNQNYYICEDRNRDKSISTSSEVSQKRTKNFTVVTGNELSWFGALVDCKRQGLRLATIESEEEQQQVVDLIKSAVGSVGYETNFWLSGSDLGQEDGYVWMTTGEPLDYTAWYRSRGVYDVTQPDHYMDSDGFVEHCLSVRGIDHSWNDLVCSKKYNYICDNQN